MSLAAVLVEAFAERPCQGNGAAVVRLKQPFGDTELQAIARSLNQSETAFLLRYRQAWLLRWFTPSVEVPLCGHATLAALLALGHWGELAPGQALALQTRSGPLAVQRHPTAAEGGAVAGSIVLPSSGLRPQRPPAALQELLRRALGECPLEYWDSPLGYRVGLLSPAAPLEQLRLPLDRLPPAERQGLVLMQALGVGDRPQVMGEPADYQLRFFAPGLGIAEDPVTGSAHALVAPYWQAVLGRRRVVGWQCSIRPGGMVCEGASSGMIRLSGSGHLLWNGTLYLPGFGAVSGSWDSMDSEGWRSLLA